MVRVRFAPSPTGHLHVGSARVAIFNWLFARHNDGKFLVRIEDTDINRSKQEFVDSIISSMEWLRINADEDIVYQMQNLEKHKSIISKLKEQGLIYPCFCPMNLDSVNLDSVNLDSKNQDVRGYSGVCRDKIFTEEDLKKPHAFRFRLPDKKEIIFDDLIRGKIRIELKQLDDFVVVRSDGIPTYNFVVVIDDIAMDITHIIRGEDHISNTPKQILIYEALNKKPPIFAHLPLILGKNGARLSKRDAATSLEEYKDLGILPDAMFNYLIRLGWSHGDQEVFTREEIIKFFSLDNVGKKGAIFDIKKLQWLNGIYIRELNLKEFMVAIDTQGDESHKDKLEIWGDDLEKVFELYKSRAVSIKDLAHDIISLANDPEIDIDLISKWRTDNTNMLVEDFIERLEIIDTLEHDLLLVEANKVCEEYGAKLVELAQAVRLGLTGTVKSPGIFDIITVLGEHRTIQRLNKLLEKLQATTLSERG